MSKLVKLFILKRQIVLLSLIFFVFFGMYSYYLIPKQENPNTNLPAALITTVYPGATSTEVEEMVTKKIEDKLSRLAGIDVLDSYSVNSASVVVIMFKIDVDADVAMAGVRELMADVQKELPPLAMESVIKSDLTEVPQFIISLSNDEYNMDDLVTYAQSIQTEIEQVNGVTRVDIDGNLEKQVVINVNIDDLYLYRVSMETIVGLLQAQNLTIPSGSIDYDDSKINVQTPATFETLKDIENIVISGSMEQVGFVRLKDVATISIEAKNQYFYQHNGQNAVLLTGYFENDTNAVIIGGNVRKVIDAMKAQVPQDIEFSEVTYSPEDIDRSINSFIFNLLESIVLIVIIVMIGVHLRNALIMSIILPISILVTFIVMFLMKIEFHFISIAALIISLGILVDNGIVICEAIQSRLNDGEEKLLAIENAVKETSRPIFTSTLTTIVTFGILLFIPGVIGKTVATIPIVIISTLIASYFTAMLILPVFAYLFFKPESQQRIEKTKRSPVRRFFDEMLIAGLRYPKMAIALAFATLLIAALLFTQLNMSFFPYSDKPVIYINVEAESASLEKTSEIHDQIYQLVTEFSEVKSVTSSVGTGLPKFFITVVNSSPALDVAQLLLTIDLTDSLYKSNEEFGFAIQQRINETVIGAKVEVRYLEYAMPVEAKLVFALNGEDLDDLLATSANIRELLSTIPGTTSIRDSFVSKEYEYVVRIDEDYLATSGILKYDIVKQINTALMGATPSGFKSGGTEMEILVKADINSLEQLYRLPIKSSATDAYMQLSQLARVDIQATLPSIYRQNRKRTVTVLADVLPGYSAASIELAFKELINEDLLIGDSKIDYKGELKNITDLVSNLGISALIVIALIYMILLVQFDKLSKPLIIMTSIPLSLTGVFLGLYIFQIDIQAMALLGAVSLIGIVVNNGILLMEVMDEGVRMGKSVISSCKDAVDQRYRPIMLTTLTTCIGLVPLIISNDPMTSPMALVLFFGLLMSTILTMVIVPVLYHLIIRENGG